MIVIKVALNDRYKNIKGRGEVIVRCEPLHNKKGGRVIIVRE